MSFKNKLSINVRTINSTYEYIYQYSKCPIHTRKNEWNMCSINHMCHYVFLWLVVISHYSQKCHCAEQHFPKYHCAEMPLRRMPLFNYNGVQQIRRRCCGHESGFKRDISGGPGQHARYKGLFTGGMVEGCVVPNMFSLMSSWQQRLIT